MLHISIQTNKHITGKSKGLSRLLCISIMFSQKILTCKNNICPSNFQTLLISERLYKKGQISCLITCTKVFCMISYSEVHLTLSSMKSMATNMNKKTQTMMCMCYQLMKKNNKATRMKMRMIKHFK